MIKVTRSICRWCHSMCRVKVYSEDGKLLRIEEDPTDPRRDQIFPPTRACIRLNGAKEYVYHPNRVKFPLKRKGEKGENKWERITWDQALDEIGYKITGIMNKYGPEAVMCTYGTSRSTVWAWRRFMNALGSPNMIGQGSICYGPSHAPTVAMFGWTLRHRTHLILEAGVKSPTKSIFIIGADPSNALLRLWKSLRDARKSGEILIVVVDPRRTRTAELADIWLQVKPGTDTALLMSLIQVIIEEELYDREFVERWCYGFDKLAERSKAYSPEKSSKITWVSAEKIKETARALAQHQPGVYIHGMGIEHLENNQEAIQAKNILSAILGGIDKEGGDYLTGPPDCISEADMQLPEKLIHEQRRKQIGADRFKMLSWPGRELIWEQNERFYGKKSVVLAYAHYPSVMRAIITGKPYPVKAGITAASNPLVTQANTKLVYRALKTLDLYVVKDFWLIPSAQLADYVLPTTCWLERPDLETNHGSDNVIVAGEAALPAVIPGEYEYHTDYSFFRDLGMRLGQEGNWPWESLEEVYDFQLEPLGTTFQDFMKTEYAAYTPLNEYKKYEKRGGFGTPTGKIEFCSTIIEKLGYDPLPHYEEPKENSVSRTDLIQEFPLMLITGGRIQPYFHSEHRQIESIRRKRPNPIAQIHPATAKALGIEDGDWVWIETPRGRIRQKCEYFDGIHPQVIHAEHGWWFPELPGEEPWLGGIWESNINVTIDDDIERCNERSGGWPLKTALCKVYKCNTY